MKEQKILSKITIFGGFIVLLSLALYTFKIIDLEIVKAIIFSLVAIKYSFEAYILHKNKRSIGASRILMIIGFGVLGIMTIIEIFQR